jgi:hypothetical protein
MNLDPEPLIDRTYGTSLANNSRQNYTLENQVLQG